MALEPITRQEQIIAGKGLTPITRMEKFLKEFGGGSGGGGGAQPDWNAADGEPGHILNRPFGDLEVVIVPEMSLATSAMEEMNGMIAAFVEIAAEIVEGNEYIVKFGDAEYVCTYSMGLGNMVFVGGEDTGEPFLFMSTDGLNVVLTSEPVSGIPFSIKGVQAVPVPRKYAPEAVLIDLMAAGLPTVKSAEVVSCTFTDEKIFKEAYKKGAVKIRLKMQVDYDAKLWAPDKATGVNSETAEAVVSASIRGADVACNYYYITAVVYNSIINIRYDVTGLKVDATIRRISIV